MTDPPGGSPSPPGADPPAGPAHHRSRLIRSPRVDDDLLAGFDRPGRRRTELRGFFAGTLAASVFVFEIAFDFGAYHTVFYSRLLQLFVVSVVLLLGAVALRGNITVRPWMLPVIGTPILWFLFRLFSPRVKAGAYHAIDLALIGLTVLTLPLMLWVLARILAPDFFALSSLRLRATAVVIVALVAALGLLVGQFNNHVLSCQDFIVAGDDTPANCRQLPSAPPSTPPSPPPSTPSSMPQPSPPSTPPST